MSKATTRTQSAPQGAGVDQLLTAADLPEPITIRIAAIVRSTRLWKSEQADIARELVAHAHDALAAGQTPEEAAANLGDPRTIAPLLRRGTRRKRPWHWQARHRALQTIGVSSLLIIAFYAVLFVRFNAGSPTVKHDYFAELNQRNSAFPASEHALPEFEALYYAWRQEQEALMAWDKEYRQATEQEDVRHDLTAFEHFPTSRPGTPGYDRLLAAHARVRPRIDAAIAASRLPVLGFLYSDRHERITAEDGSVRTRMLPPTEDPSFAGPVIDVLLPSLGHARGYAELIAFDAVLAARADDPSRAADSLTAVFDIARLVGQEHSIITSLLAMTIQNMGETVLIRILHDHPDLLSESNLNAITQTAANSGRISRTPDFATETRKANDLLQRIYTDDGRGDGRITADGLRLLTELRRKLDDLPNGQEIPAMLPNRLSDPIATLPIGSRHEQREMLDSMMRLANASLQIAPSDPSQSTFRAEMAERVNRMEQSRRYEIVNLVIAGFPWMTDKAHTAEAHTNATLTTIALHIHRQRTGQWPATLDELVPQLLTAVPEDPFDPGRPIKYRLIDGVPHVYFVGADGRDNHAARPVEPASTSSVSSLKRRYEQDHPSPSAHPSDQGDWIIFPPQPAAANAN